MTFPVSHARVEPGRLRFFLDTLGETNPVYRNENAANTAGPSDRPVPPTYLFCLEFLDGDDPLKVFDALEVDIARVLHGEQRFVYRAPVYVGDALTFRSSVTGVPEKKGGALTLVDVATEVTNQRGEHGRRLRPRRRRSKLRRRP